MQSFSHVKSPSGSGSFFSSSSSKDKDKKKKEKERGKRKHKPFNLEAEKDTMKVAIAESSIAATNLVNALQTINRERERISENAAAVERFEICKKLRRKILRYVGLHPTIRVTPAYIRRFIMLRMSNGSVVYFMPTMSLL